MELTDRLTALRDSYTYRVNMLLEEGREDLATQASDEYLRDVADLLAAA